MVDFDQFQEEYGGYRKYQILLFACLSITGLPFNNMNIVFTAATPEHWCSVPQMTSYNLTTEEIKDFTIPLEEKDGEWKHSQCQMYDRNYSGLTDVDLILSGHGNDTPGVVDCQQEWVYDRSLYHSTIVTEVSNRG